MLSALRALNLFDTPIADIAPLAGRIALQSLDLGATRVADIAPLQGLSALQWLSLESTQVADIAPLAHLEGLQVLRFAGIPACDNDPKLKELASIENSLDRTRRTLAYLRGDAAEFKRNGKDTRVEIDPAQFTFKTDDASIIPPEQIRAIQRGLADAGFDPGPIDGVDRAKTREALVAAQRGAEIEATGDLWIDFRNLSEFLERRQDTPPTNDPRPDETAPFYDDEPTVKDLLNRRAVAETLGTIVDEVWHDAHEKDATDQRDPNARPDARDRTFIVHLHGRWGSGKTSILNFLRKVLLSWKIAEPKPRNPWLHRKLKPRWVIIDYNAWRNQDLGPAWWSLMDSVYREAAQQLGGWKGDGLGVMAGHYLWRFRARWLEYLTVLAVAGAIVFAAFQLDLGENWLDTAKNTGTVVAVIVGVITLLNRLSIGTARTAKQYMELSRDPMTPLIDRYSDLIRQIGRPVAVFIDDLDRCDAEFVVELLQTIQTMFRQAQVFYVVAADRDWICASYEQVYATYNEPIAEPGRSLGHMFLEKIFQISIEVPTLSGAQRNAYLAELIRGKESDTPPETPEDIEKTVDQELGQATTEVEVIEIVDKHSERGPQYAAIAGALAFKRMQSKELRAEQREHFLEGYSEHLDPNPRAMKRLLNAYGFRRGFGIQVRNRPDRDALMRWTIIENRWPVLANFLAGRSNGNVDSEAMRRLMRTKAFKEVVEGLDDEKLAPIIGAPSRAR